MLSIYNIVMYISGSELETYVHTFIGHFYLLFYELFLHAFSPFFHLWFIFNLICRNSSCIKYSSSVIYCRYFPQFDICLSLLFIMLLLSRMFWRNFYFLCSHIYPFLYCSCSGLWLMALCLILKSFQCLCNLFWYILWIRDLHSF